MINLLPPTEKQNILNEKNLKKIIILGLVLFFSLICFSLMMLFIQFDLNGKLVFQRTILRDKRKEFESSKAKELEGEILYFNKIFVDIQSFYKMQFPLAKTLEKLANLVPDGIKLSNVTFGKENRDFSFVGIAETREILLALKKNLENEKSFQGIYFPPSSWVSPENINFLVKFKVQ
jgi:hypothetical protein